MRGATHRIPGLTLTDHRFDVPLDYAQPDGRTISIYAREVVAHNDTTTGANTDDLPWLLFLQGGPGFGAPRPMGLNGFLKPALQEYRLLLLDQRGTSLSSPITSQTLAHLEHPHEQANYLRHFRADSIVRDCEFIRTALLGDRKWSVLGQSYGGFCTCTYLSFAPEGLEGAFITGGIPPVGVGIDDIYRTTYAAVRDKNRLYFERYPDDAALARRIVSSLLRHPVTLPEGDRLSVRKFQQLGMHLGMSDGFEIVHYLLEKAFLGPTTDELSHAFLHEFEHSLSFNTNPIFSILHEAAYAEGSATRWSAERLRGEFPEFHVVDEHTPVLFTGEMIYPWMFEEYGRLHPLAGAAQILADKDDWPALYDTQQLRWNRIPTVAAIYENDMYVARELSLGVTIGNLRTWVTSAYEHNGLRSYGDFVFAHLLELSKSRTPLV
jgi:pimeloyl-ACP methyl ester carboxylesterase